MRLPTWRKVYISLNQIEVEAHAITQNYHVLGALHSQAAIAPVLKSNAYGHGLRTVGPIFDELKPPFLVVDSLYEAYELHKRRVKTPILIMGYTNPANWKVKRLPFHVAIFDLETAQALNTHQPGCQVHLFVDTGMGREGVTTADLPEFLEALKKMTNLQVVGLCSHLADADNPNSSKSWQSQIELYKNAYQLVREAGFDPQWRHIGASAATLKMRDPLFNLYRVGLASYGISPLSENDPAHDSSVLRPALRFISTIAQIKEVPKGTPIGYNHTARTHRRTKLGIIPAGYYDGVDRRLSNKGVMKVGDNYCPILGRVSMNTTTIDLTDCPSAVVGDEVEIYSNRSDDKNSILAVAASIDTIPYEVLVHLAESVKRVVI